MASNVMVDTAENEQIIHEIHRHPVGIVPIIGTGAAVIALMFVLLISLGQYSDTIARFVPPVAVYAIIGAVMIFALILTFVVVGIYNANELIITTENLIQVLQKTLFNRQTSHLNLADVQDVTIDKRGIFAYIFDFGNLTIETAGEAANFSFRTAKDPELAARLIVEAHEQFMKKSGIPQV
jgi:uncharacterized membrane protein YdbT with pleckstrin-like domain